MRVSSPLMYLPVLVLGLLAVACGPAAGETPQPGPSPSPPGATSTPTGVPPTPTAPTPTIIPSPLPTVAPSVTPAVVPPSGQGSASPASTSAAVSVQPTAVATPSTAEPPIITLDDNGRTLELHTGERFLLKLGTGYDWTVQVADESVVSRVVNVLVVQGAQGIYEAKLPGQTTLRAIGDPPCRKVQPPCAAPSRLFQMTIVVR